MVTVSERRSKAVLQHFFLFAVLCGVALIPLSRRSQSLAINDVSSTKGGTEAQRLTALEVRVTQLEKLHPNLRSTSQIVTSNTDDRPPISTLIDEKTGRITGEVNWLVNFAIVGHPKCATSSMMRWLASQEDEIVMHIGEIHALRNGKPAELVRKMYDLPSGSQFKRGYKAPREIGSTYALSFMSRYFPKTKLIVGIRHPINWFESFYNYRVHSDNITMPPAEELIGSCAGRPHGVCTHEARFHNHLSYLGKTNVYDVEESELFLDRPKNLNMPPRLSNPVFLYEVSQLHDTDQTRTDNFYADFKDFLGLERDLNPMKPPPANPKGAFNICEDKYGALRAELMKISQSASTWIREYFLKSSEVHVSSPDHFKELLEKWMVDPCDHEGTV